LRLIEPELMREDYLRSIGKADMIPLYRMHYLGMLTYGYDPSAWPMGDIGRPESAMEEQYLRRVGQQANGHSWTPQVTGPQETKLPHEGAFGIIRPAVEGVFGGQDEGVFTSRP